MALNTPPPPPSIDPTVWRTLRRAHTTGDAVTVWLRGDPLRGRPARELHGRPMRFDLDVDGQVRVALAVAEGTEQRVVIARIVRALAHQRARDTVPSPPTAVVVGDEPELRDVLAAVLAVDDWHVEQLALDEARAAAAATPSLLVLAAGARRADATLAAAHALRQQSALVDTPILLAASARFDIAPGFRQMSRVRVLVAPFGVAELRAALSDLGVTAQGD